MQCSTVLSASVYPNYACLPSAAPLCSLAVAVAVEFEVAVEVASPQPPPLRAPPIASLAGPSFSSLQWQFNSIVSSNKSSQYDRDARLYLQSTASAGCSSKAEVHQMQECTCKTLF
jgi:hypothetical protein